jgi:serine/threonine protein kinase
MPEVARQVGRYEILRELGRGGMAIVYLARQTDLDRYVALKELAAFHQTDPTFARRFVRESRLAAALSHPNIVTVHDYFEHDGVPYIAMEYIERGSLRPYVKRLTLPQMAGVLEGVLAGLAHAETRGVVHRDLKPENLMLTADGRVKIADFGIAKATSGVGTSAMLTATGMTVGTPAYMAPEQAMALPIGPWTDLYSVGCMAYEMLSGSPPFTEGESPMAILLQHVNKEPAPLRAANPSIDPALVKWVDALLVKDPKERVGSASDAWDEFEEIVIGVAGPRWRKEARLIYRGGDADTPRPLTPAPFQSDLTQTPPETESAPQGAALDEPPASPEPAVSGEFESFHLGGKPVAEPEPAPSPAEPPAPEPEPEPEPGPEPPVAEETPTPAPVADAPEEPIVASSEFLTFQPATAPPADPSPATQERPEAAPPPPPREVPQPPAEPAQTATPAAAPEHEADAGATVAPRRAPEPAVAAMPPKSSTAVAARRRLVALVVGIVVVFALIGYLAAPSRTKHEPAAAARTVASDALTLRYPAGFTPRSVPSIRGLQLADARAVAPAGRPQLAVVAGRTQATGPTLIPSGLSRGVGQLPKPSRVRLGKLEALRYDSVRLTGSTTALRLYAVPTSSGTVLIACEAPAAGLAALTPGCDHVAASLQLRSGHGFPAGPSTTYADALAGVLTKLGAARSEARSQIAAAKTAAGQATAATRAAAAYGQAATTLRALKPSPYDAAANTSLASALAQTGSAYGRLARAARDRARGRYRSARAAVGRGERSVTAALAALTKLGYEVSG